MCILDHDTFFLTFSAIGCFALIVLKCECIAIACTKSTVSHFVFSDRHRVDPEEGSYALPE